MDRATMVDKLLEGAGKAAYGPVPAGSPWFTAGTERLYDLAKAKKILDEAGWIPGADGIRSRNGVRAAFPLWYTSGDKICQDQALAFASDAKKAGIHVTAESGSWEVIESRMRTDAVLGGGGSPADPDFDQYLTLNSALTGDGFNNMARYDNPAVDKALLEGRRSGDPAVRKGAYDTVQRLPWGPMARMPGRRILFAGPVLLVVTFGVFAVAALSPFDPVKAYAGAAGLTASQAGLDQLRAHLGADQPLLERWWEWLASALTGDLGTSAVMRRRAHRHHRRLRPPRPRSARRPPEPRPRRIPRTARPQWLRQVHPGRGRRAAAPA